MKHTLKIIAATAAILATASAVNAQSLSDELGAAYTTILSDTFDQGLNQNLAINTAEINGNIVVELGDSVTLTEESNAGNAVADIANATSESLAGTAASLGDVKTVAVGALNTGVINAGSVSTLVDTTTIVATDDGSASNTSGTAAEAASIATETTYNVTTSVGAIVQASNTNLAYNESLIDGSVSITGGIDVNAASISATALGAVNDGSISLGDIIN